MITDDMLRASGSEMARELLALRNQVRVQLVAAAISGHATNERLADNIAEWAVELADATLAAMGRK